MVLFVLLAKTPVDIIYCQNLIHNHDNLPQSKIQLRARISNRESLPPIENPKKIINLAIREKKGKVLMH